MNEFLQLTDFDTDEAIFIAPESIKSIQQLPKTENYGRRTVLTEDTKNMEFLVKEEATLIALATGRGIIDKVDLLKRGTEYNNSSKIHKRFSESLNNPRVLENPEEFLGENFEAVLNFWLIFDELSEEQLRIVNERYWAFFNGNRSEWDEATELAYYVSKKVVGGEYADNAKWATYDVTNSMAAVWATREILGNVENPTFLPMFDNL
jgi:hypothetical protein